MSGLTFIAAARAVFTPGPKSIVYTVPALAVKGDVLVAVVAYVNADSYAVPAGWTRSVHLVGTAVTLDALVRQVDDNEPSSVTLTAALATSEWQGELLVFRGGSPAAIIEASAIGSYVAAATPNAPAVSTQQAISLELCAWSTTGANVPVPPAGFTVVDGYASALASSRSFGVGFVIANATGALPVRGATGANPSTGSALSLVLRDRVPVVPAVLEDPVPGNIGIRSGPSSNIVLRFDEADDHIMPSDYVGNLDDLGNDGSSSSGGGGSGAGWLGGWLGGWDGGWLGSSGGGGGGTVIAPGVATAWTGRGRHFQQSLFTGFVTQDSPNGNTLQQRDVTIRVILSLDLPGAAGIQTLIARGTHNGDPGEPYCYGLELQEQDAHPGFLEVRWFWEDNAGALHVQPGGVFQNPGDGKFFMLTATRRWEATGRVVIRYYVGDQLIAELVSTNGDIGGGTTGHTTVGGRKSGGSWLHFFSGVIDELVVDDVEISGDEIGQTHARFVDHQPAGSDMFAGLAPPGAPWNLNPGNFIGKNVKIAGQALGQPRAIAELLRAMWLPDAAALDQLVRWERLNGIVPKARDSLDARRQRVIAYMSRQNGFSRPQVQAALSELLALDPSTIQILEFGNTIRDTFETLDTQRWLAGPIGAWSIAANKLALHVAAGTDVRWEPTRAGCHLRMPIPMPATLFYASCQLPTYALATNTLAGLWVHNRRTNNSLWFGVRYDGVFRRVGYRTFIGGVMGAFVNLAAAAVAGPEWLRVQQVSNTGFAGANDRTYRLSWSSGGGATSDMTTTDVVLTFPDPEWIGFAALAEDGLAATAADLDVTFDDFMLHAPQSVRPFYWYAYRDPALPGSPDLDAGNRVARRIAPAHTVTAAIGSKQVLCDDPLYGRCDRGPLGGI